MPSDALIRGCEEKALTYTAQACYSLQMKLLIKNMVSLRCKMIVKSELENMGLHFTVVELGEVEITEELSAEQQQELKMALLRSGLELMEDKKSMLIEKIKNIVVEMVHYSDDPPILNFSAYLSEKLQYDYNYLSNLFSEAPGHHRWQYTCDLLQPYTQPAIQVVAAAA